MGAAIDIPASLVMALRVIYQVGRSYGFDLSKESDQDIVQHIFRQIDLGLIAEKQAVLMALKTLSSTIQSSDISQLQQMLGSGNDTEVLKKYFLDESGQYKWPWLNQLPKVSLLDKLAKLTPFASAGVGAVYSWRLVDEANQKAQQVFSHAREYLIQHADLQLPPLAAYEKSLELLAQAGPKLLESIKSIESSLKEPVLDQAVEISGNQNISQVKVLKKTHAAPASKEEKAAQVADELNALAEKEVAPSAAVPPQQPALAAAEDDFLEDGFADDGFAGSDLAPVNEASAEAAEPPKKPAKKRVTKKPADDAQK